MARMNQKLDVLKKLGTLPACSHDLSILYNVAGINSRGQHLGQGKAFEHASPAEIIRILLQPNILKMVALFSVLASTGNIETFGLSNVWPELLRHEAHGGLHEAVGPAVKLMFIVSVGIPVGVLCALISLSNAASHKIYIMIAGFLGCVGLTCILVFEHSSALLLTSMLITHMSGTLEYSVAMIWCEESFPTKVRASATGVVIFFGTLWSVTSPLLLTAVGEKGCSDKAKKYVEKQKAGTAEKRKAELKRLQGMTGNEMKEDNRNWLMSRINLLKKMSEQDEL
eukprot:g10436.t1